MKGSIIDNFRLPPDPKLGKGTKALLPDLSPYELDMLRQMIRGIRDMSEQNISYARVLFASGGSGKSTSTIKNTLQDYEPLFKKILGE